VLTFITAFWQHHVSAIVGRNAYQGHMAIEHGLAAFIYVPANTSVDQQLQSSNSRCALFPYKVLADTIEALMGAICLDGDASWAGTLEHFMREFELDSKAAIQHLKH
jgi:dsRNA-specific ribonuclease